VPALGKTVEGTIREIAVVANPLTRTYDVKVGLANPAGDLRVGMVAEIYLQASDGPAELVVPPEAVRVDERGAPYVFVVGLDDRLQRRSVKVSRFVGEGTALTEGVRDGERVVTSGTPMLTDGLAVRVVTAPATKGIP